MFGGGMIFYNNIPKHSIQPGGSIFITTLNKTISMWLVGVLFGEYVLQAIPIGTHQYNKMISPADVERILKTSELKKEIRNI